MAEFNAPAWRPRFHLRRAVLAAACLSAGLGWTGAVQAKEAESAAANPAIEARMMALATELRCLVCQNQTIADSHSGLAEDLRRQIREMLERGDSDEQVMAYMTQRYGDFVLYKPPFKATTAVLWLGPAALMVLALGSLAVVLRRRQKLGDDAFDPDDEDEVASTPAASPTPPPSAR